MSVARALAFALLVACGGSAEPPPVLMEVPSFRLVDQTGEAFGSDELRGRVWVANTIFTTCPTVCPLLTSQMANLQRRFAERELDVRLVSFSVDPENDTPEALAAYAQRNGADPARWRFLTGEREALRTILEDGLRVRMGGERSPSGDIAHGTHFVLVDASARLRGFYANDGAGLGKLERDVAAILAD
ncbi:MAG: SCO family protein [Myxococcota bacterium]